MAAHLASLAEYLAGKDARGRPVFLQLLCRGGAPRFEVRMGPMGLPASTVPVAARRLVDHALAELRG
jgi:hypothetical protein